MKKVTGIGFIRTAAGLQVSYNYTELDGNGNVLVQSTHGSYVNMDPEVESFVTKMEETVSKRLQ